MNRLNQLSEDLLLAVKTNRPIDTLLDQANRTPLSDFYTELNNDTLKLTFWINVYNAFYQVLRKKYNLKNPKIFTQKAIHLGTVKMCLDDIEHGILRRGMFKYSLGYVRNPFVSEFIKNLGVSSIDYRIHFALNCGAKSCPPILFYSPGNLEEHLKAATHNFLVNETYINEERKEIRVSKIFFWFLGDFGGRDGIRKILQDVLNLDSTNYKIVFNKYSWDEHLDNYKEMEDLK